MYRNVLTSFLLILMVVATGSTLYSVHKTDEAVDSLASVANTLMQREAVRLVGTIIRTDGYTKVEAALCGEKATAMCQLVTGKSYDNLGRHNDIWVGLDAAATLAKAANLGDDRRQTLERYRLDLAVALNEQGAWQAAQVGTMFPDRIGTVELYKATVTMAMACQQLPDMLNCRKGLPVPVADALLTLIAYTADQGPVVDPYSANIRSAGVKAVLAAL